MTILPSVQKFTGVSALLLFVIIGLGCGGPPEEEATDVYIEKAMVALDQAVIARTAARNTTGKTRAQSVNASRLYKRQLQVLANTVDQLNTENVYPEAIALGEAISDWAREMDTLLKQQSRPAGVPDTGLQDIGARLAGANDGELIEKLFDNVIKQESALREAHDYTNETLTGFCDQIVEHRAK